MVHGESVRGGQEAKLCPMRTLLGVMLPCERERCAWWRGKGCAVAEGAYWLSEIWTALPPVTKDLTYV